MVFLSLIGCLVVLVLYAILDKLYYLKTWVRFLCFGIAGLFLFTAIWPYYTEFRATRDSNDLLEGVDLGSEVKDKVIQEKKIIPIAEPIAEVKKVEASPAINDVVNTDEDKPSIESANQLIAEITHLLKTKVRPEIRRIKENMEYAKDSLSGFYLSNQRKLIEMESLDDLLEVRQSILLKEIKYYESGASTYEDFGYKVKYYKNSVDSLVNKYY
jgi:hypothetical protein